MTTARWAVLVTVASGLGWMVLAFREGDGGAVAAPGLRSVGPAPAGASGEAGAAT